LRKFTHNSAPFLALFVWGQLGSLSAAFFVVQTEPFLQAFVCECRQKGQKVAVGTMDTAPLRSVASASFGGYQSVDFRRNSFHTTAGMWGLGVSFK